MAELKAALEDALSGRGRLVMLAGEPGIGKTRTSQELAAYATLRGAQVLWGRCHAAEGAPPYWPWVQVVRSYLREYDPEQLRSQMGAGAADIAEVVPEVKERLPELEPPPALEPEQARFRLFDSITKFFQQAAQGQPLMMVLDNLHWADRPSLLLLEFLAQEMAESRLLLVGTYRDAELTRRHPLAQTLGELAREPSFRRVPLRGLIEEEVGRFIEASSGFTPPHDLVRAVHSQTEGSPLFMTEVVRLLAQEGDLAPGQANEGQGWSILIPASVREVIGRRLDRLSERCNQALTIASVIGREFELRLLERLMDQQSGDELLEAVEEALAARVIEDLLNAVGRYQFTHVLIQDTLAHELSAARRARLHRRIGEALEELYAGNIEVHAAELAYHFAQAVVVGSSEKLVHYSLLAGERALAAYAWEDALSHFERALAAKEGQAMDAETAALLFGLGRAQLAILDPREYQEALANLTRAFDYYAEKGDVGRAVAVAQCPVQASPSTGHRTGVIDLIARALALVPPDSHEAGRLLCQYGNTLYYETGDYDGALTALSQALAIAQREGDAALKMRALVAAGHAEAAHLHFQESLGYDLRAIELASSVDEPFEETHAHQEVAAVLHRTGDLEGARQHAAVMLEVAERLRHRTRLWQALQANTVVSSLEGDWATARSSSDRALAVSPRNSNLLGYRALIEYVVGDFDQGRAYLERLLETMRRATPGPTFEYAYPAIVVPLIAHLAGINNRLEEASTAAHAVLSSPWVTPVLATLARAGLALLAVSWGENEAAEEQYSALRPRSGTMVGGLLDSIVSADRLLGLLARAMGNLDQAMAHFEDALAFCRKAGYRPELAWSLCDYAAMLLAHNRPGDRARVRSLLEESLSISSELGMKPLVERVAARLERLQALPHPAPAYPEGLTQREAQVLRLVASGKTSTEIAAELVLSRRTVERHISNIYNKTNTHSRAEATAFAFTHRLVLPEVAPG
jgi:DNA-binding CsgD family transcriptional regulator